MNNEDNFSALAMRILLVDDSPSDRAIFRRYLLQSNTETYEFVDTESVEEAIDSIAEKKPHCILLDYDLPDANGTDLIEKISNLYGKNSIPIVMLSGSGNIEIAVEAMRLGAQDFLVKDRATPIDLLRAVTNAVDKVKLYQEKELASEKILHSEERYRLLFDNTPLPALVFDRETLAVLAVNDFAVSHYGYSREEFTLMTLNELDAFDGASAEIVISEFCNEKGLIRNIPARHRKKDGSIIDVEVNCHDITFKGRDARFVIVQDITERKKSESKLRESEQFNRTVIESSPDCVKLLDKNGKLVFMNENGLRLMEIDDFTEFENRDWAEFWSDESRAMVKETLASVQSGEIGRFVGACPTAKGKSRWWDVIATPVRGSDGSVEKILSVSRDITESKTAEQEREQNLLREQELREQAETANRSKDEFLAVLSHELRTPLNAMSGWAKMLNRGILDEEKTQKAIEVIERNIRLQNTLIEDLLDVSRIISGKFRLEMTKFDLCKIIHDALELVRAQVAEKSIVLTTETENEECFATGDAHRLQQVINNLLTNAVKFTPDDGNVSITLKTHGTTAKITVTDSGIGIDESLLPDIFERFRQADGSSKRKYGGLGLGLAIVKSIVEMHGGEVSAHSAGENQGSTFVVTLPIVIADAVTNDELQSSEVHSNGAGQTTIVRDLENVQIIIVDDEADSLELLRFVLASHGAKVTALNSAAEALRAIEKISPDLLISDISMAEMDGYDLIKRVRRLSSAKNKFLPAIAMTAYTGVEDRAAVLSAGFQMHIAKPIDIESVSSQIKQLLKTTQR